MEVFPFKIFNSLYNFVSPSNCCTYMILYSPKLPWKDVCPSVTGFGTGLKYFTGLSF